MSNAAAREAYEYLIAVVEKAPGVEWMAQEIKAEISVGSLSLEPLKATTGLVQGRVYESHFPRGPRVTKDKFLAQAEFSDREMFELVESALRAIASAPLMQDDIAKVTAFRSRVVFVSEHETMGENAFDLATVASAKEDSKHLLALLEELRQAVSDAD